MPAPCPFTITVQRGGVALLFDYDLLGQTIKNIRRYKGLSQEVLSGLAGIARSHLAMIENGTMHPSIETLCKIAQALDLQASELIYLVESKVKNEKQ